MNVTNGAYPTTAPAALIVSGFDTCPSCGIASKPANQMVCRECEAYLVAMEAKQ